ncbi:ankyrin repeat domain-containing protein [Serratia ureilytica]
MISSMAEQSREAKANAEGRRLRRALAIALLALVAVTGLLMMAKEQQMGQEISPFDGHSNLALAQAVARGDTQGIHAQATQDRLRERGDRQVTLLQWAVLSQQPDSVQALLDLGADPAAAGLDGNSALHTAAMPVRRAVPAAVAGQRGAGERVYAVTGATPLAAAVLAGRRRAAAAVAGGRGGHHLERSAGDTRRIWRRRLTRRTWRCCCCRPGPMPGAQPAGLCVPVLFLANAGAFAE